MKINSLGIASPIVLLIIIPPLLSGNRFLVTVLTSSLVFSTLAAVYDLNVGYARIFNFGFGAFFGIGAYTSGLMSFHLGLPGWYGMLPGAAFATGIGFLAGVLTLRLRGVYVAMMTWFLAEALRLVFANLVDYTRGYIGLVVEGNTPLNLGLITIDPSSFSRLPYYYVLLALCLVMYFVLRKVVNSKAGLAFKALREDEDAAETLGIDTTRYKLLNFMLASFFAGLIGAFYANWVGVLTPDIFGVTLTVQVLSTTYVGGRGTLWGPMVAGFILIPFFEIWRPFAVLQVVVYGLLLIVAMVFAPRGLAGLITSARAKLR